VSTPSESHSFYVTSLLQNLLAEPATLDGADIAELFAVLDDLSRSDSPQLAALAADALRNMRAHAQHRENVESVAEAMRAERRVEIERALIARAHDDDLPAHALRKIQRAGRALAVRRSQEDVWAELASSLRGLDDAVGLALVHHAPPERLDPGPLGDQLQAPAGEAVHCAAAGTAAEIAAGAVSAAHTSNAHSQPTASHHGPSAPRAEGSRRVSATGDASRVQSHRASCGFVGAGPDARATQLGATQPSAAQLHEHRRQSQIAAAWAHERQRQEQLTGTLPDPRYALYALAPQQAQQQPYQRQAQQAAVPEQQAELRMQIQAQVHAQLQAQVQALAFAQQMTQLHAQTHGAAHNGLAGSGGVRAGGGGFSAASLGVPPFEQLWLPPDQQQMQLHERLRLMQLEQQQQLGLPSGPIVYAKPPLGSHKAEGGPLAGRTIERYAPASGFAQFGLPSLVGVGHVPGSGAGPVGLGSSPIRDAVGMRRYLR
jgi:hypothetical protein